MKQVFINLVSNALKYNKPGGHILLSADIVENEHHLSIKDNGIGMSQEIVDHLFEKFYRAQNTEDKIHGTGLGLSICKKIIENHNGRISVKSAMGVGNRIRDLASGKIT